MNEKQCRKLARELNEKTRWDFKIRKYTDDNIVLSYTDHLGYIQKRKCDSFERVMDIMNDKVAK